MLVVRRRNRGVLPAAAEPLLVSWSSTADLLLFALSRAVLVAYRPDGTRVWTLAVRGRPTIAAVAWSNDGTSIAASYTDGYVRICDANLGKVSSTLPLPPGDISLHPPILAWLTLDIDNSAVNVSPESALRDFFSPKIEAHLPKLSALPTAAPDSPFTSQPILDALFRPDRASDIDCIVLASQTDPTTISLSLGIQGTFAVPDASISTPLVPLAHTPTSATHAHYLICHDPTLAAIVLLPLCFRFLPRFGSFFSLLTTSSTKLQYLARYLQDAIASLADESTALQTAIDTLFSSVDTDIRKDLLTLLVIGVASPTCTEWIKNDLGERGIKKWKKSVTSAYDSFNKLLTQHIVPACERAIVILQELHGLALWAERGKPLGLDPDTVEAAIASIELLALKAYNIAATFSKEQNDFCVFIQWLSDIYDYDTKGNAYPSLDAKIQQVEDYIETSLRRPKLAQYHDSEENLSSMTCTIDENIAAIFDKTVDIVRNQIDAGLPFPLDDLQSDTKLQFDTRMLEDGYTCVLTCSGSTLNLCKFRAKNLSTDVKSLSQIDTMYTAIDTGNLRLARFVSDTIIACIVDKSTSLHLVLVSLDSSTFTAERTTVPAQIIGQTDLEDLPTAIKGHQIDTEVCIVALLGDSKRFQVLRFNV
ncbi:hypothetical protein CANCADRAFT_142582 [Tortispora caseinolytica NRRL Y-17796]|uniref:Anaphase-promoting complex subunit 4 n=1 Tax=Tortispora caseinolytica NRRL Y-17796 TaxID=767744 RepID=A0A1E4TDB9_9ASCO|nr:hypothetical protein CANCADRAFT_142582 [Tortispora caseinolytica NRRL Y-17796]